MQVTSLGLTRLLISLDLSPSFFSEQEKNVGAEVRPLLRTWWMQTRYFKTMADEGEALPDTCMHVQRLGSLGDLPLTVLTATGPTWWPDLPPDIDPAKLREMWLHFETDLTKLSTNSRQVLADRSSHFIQFDQPELVVETVRQMVETARTQPTTSPNSSQPLLHQAANLAH